MKHLDKSDLVSVLLPVYNAEQTIGKTLGKILNQTYKNIEIIIINDGSTDSSEQIIKRYAESDSRIKLFSRANHGLIDTLNFAINKASGQLLVREDADDYSNADRIEKQVTFMQANENIVVCGSDYKTFGSTQTKIEMSHSPEICAAEVYFYPPVSHPSTIIRKSFLLEHGLRYSTKYKHCEDYALWVDIVRNGGYITNIDDTLHNYHNHENQVSVANSRESTRNHYLLIQEQLADLSVDVSPAILNHLHYADKSFLKELDVDTFLEVLDVYSKVFKAHSNQTSGSSGMKAVLSSLIDFKIKNVMGLAGLIILWKQSPCYYTNKSLLKIVLHAVIRTTLNFLRNRRVT
ncbi:glycosyltransferase family 2 protein [Alteromonas sp. BMJM2]|uniref:glycosyltransferase family 2 protein n=1 Tax=Alteromonas sp. BMJM2 TaxID=2954241 RepID=UPI0022B53314|nr:glycosyltransferase family 2 protein [Alteromonas sp. BMJM2]